MQPASPKIAVHFLHLLICLFVALCVRTFHVHNKYVGGCRHIAVGRVRGHLWYLTWAVNWLLNEDTHIFCCLSVLWVQTTVCRCLPVSTLSSVNFSWKHPSRIHLLIFLGQRCRVKNWVCLLWTGIVLCWMLINMTHTAWTAEAHQQQGCRAFSVCIPKRYRHCCVCKHYSSQYTA